MYYKQFAEYGDYINSDGYNVNLMEVNWAYTPRGLNAGWTEGDSLSGVMKSWGIAGGSYPDYDVGVAYKAGDIFRYQCKLYKALVDHTSQADWPPDQVLSLYNVIRPNLQDGEAAPWIAGEQVKAGDLRTYGGTTYKCIQAHTTQAGWEPPNVPALWAAQ